MANIILSSKNVVREPGIILNSGGTDAGFPIGNIQAFQPGKIARITNIGTDYNAGVNGWIEVDLGTEQLIDTVGVLYNSGVQNRNMIESSADQTNASWIKTNITPTAPPAGGSGTVHLETAITGLHSVLQDMAVENFTNTSFSAVVILESTTRDVRVQLKKPDGSSTVFTDFDFSTKLLKNSGAAGVWTNTLSKVTPLGNDRYMVELSMNGALGGVSLRLDVRGLLAGNSSYLGDITKGFTIYDCAVQLGASPETRFATTQDFDRAGVFWLQQTNATFGNFQTETAYLSPTNKPEELGETRTWQHGILKLDTPILAKIPRIELRQPSFTGVSLDIGAVWFSNGPSGINIEWGPGHQIIDESVWGRSKGGQIYPDAQVEKTVHDFSIQVTTKDQHQALLPLIRRAGRSKPVLMTKDPDSPYLHDQIVHGLFRKLPRMEDTFPGHAMFHDFEIEELLP